MQQSCKSNSFILKCNFVTFANMDYKELLKSNGLKATSARLAVLEAYGSVNYALSQVDLEEQFKDRFDRVTLYRTLNAFIEAGIIHRVFNPEGPIQYNLCTSGCSGHKHEDHHLHFYCISCTHTYCIDAVEIPKITLPEGYTNLSQYLVINGTCELCQH